MPTRESTSAAPTAPAPGSWEERIGDGVRQGGMKRVLSLLALSALFSCSSGVVHGGGGSALSSISDHSPSPVSPAPQTVIPPGMGMCGEVMVAEIQGRTINLGDCAALVGLRPVPRIGMSPGQTLTLLAPIGNLRPPLPTSTDPAVLKLLTAGSGEQLGVFVAEGPGAAELIIDHPPTAICVQQPTNRCIVADVVVTSP